MSGIKSRNIPNARKKTTSKTASGDGKEKDEKYSKMQESKVRLIRMVLAFAAISFVILVLVFSWYATSGSGKANGIGHGELKRLRRNKGPDMGEPEKGGTPAANHPLDTSNGERRRENLEKGLNKNPHSLQTLEQKRLALDQQVREIKATGVIMETDKGSLRLTNALQDVTRQVIRAKYGDHANYRYSYRVRVELEFQASAPDFAERGAHGTLVIEMAPVRYLPVSVHNFLEIARTWRAGEFHRNAGRVLQAAARAGAATRPLAFQEYSAHYPHVQGTVGYCGRPSGPGFYVSLRDNTRHHGPGSQRKGNPHEADANFGRIVAGDDVVQRIHAIEQRGWLDRKNWVFIRTMTILVPTGPDGDFVEWEPV